MSVRTVVVTTSWDDGAVQDLRLLRLLARYGLRGSFYVSPQGPWFGLSPAALRKIAQNQELGAHSLTHPDLRRVSGKRLKEEVSGSRQTLEDLIGGPVRMFAYPYGRRDRRVKRALLEAGYLGARTFDAAGLRLPRNRWEMGITLPVAPQLGRRELLGLARASFDHVLRVGGVWHLAGHSWEIERHRLWPLVERIFAYVSRRPGVRYLTNGGCLRQSAR